MGGHCFYRFFCCVGMGLAVTLNSVEVFPSVFVKMFECISGPVLKSLMCTLIGAHTHTHTHTHTYTHTHTHTHKVGQSRHYRENNTHVHTCAYARICAHTHTHTHAGTWRASSGRNSGAAATADPDTSKPTERQTLTTDEDPDTSKPTDRQTLTTDEDPDTSKPTGWTTLTTDEDPADGPVYPSSSSPHGTTATTSHQATGTRTASPPVVPCDPNTASQRGGATTGEATDRAASGDRGNATTHDGAATTTTTGGTTSPLHINTATAGTGKCDELGSPHIPPPHPSMGPLPPPPPPPPLTHSCRNWNYSLLCASIYLYQFGYIFILLTTM